MRLLHRDQHNEAGDHDSDRDVSDRDVSDRDVSDRDVRVDGPDHLDGDTTVARRDDDVMTTGDPRSMTTVRREPATIHERTWTFAPGQLISFVVGVGLVIVGLVAMLRAGVDGSFGTPTVDVLTYPHTAWLGLAEVSTGLLLVLAGSGAWGRPLSVLIGAAMVVAGVLVVAEIDQMPEELALEEQYGWPVIALGALVAMAAMALPVWRRRAIKESDIVDLRERGDLRVEDAKHAHF